MVYRDNNNFINYTTKIKSIVVFFFFKFFQIFSNFLSPLWTMEALTSSNVHIFRLRHNYTNIVTYISIHFVRSTRFYSITCDVISWYNDIKPERVCRGKGENKYSRNWWMLLESGFKHAPIDLYGIDWLLSKNFQL